MGCTPRETTNAMRVTGTAATAVERLGSRTIGVP
jgi:hypothetical protein